MTAQRKKIDALLNTVGRRQEDAGAGGIFNDLYVIECASERCQSNRRMRTRHNYFVMHYILLGSGKLVFGGKDYHCGPDDIFFVLPGVETEYCADKINPWYYVYIGFNGKCAAKIMEMMKVSDMTPIIHVKRDTLVRDALQDFVNEVYEYGKTSIRVMGKLYRLFALIIEKRQPEVKLSRKESYVLAAANYINDYIGEDVSLETIAFNIGLNVDYFCEIFKEIMGLSVKQYIIEQRMKYARGWLISSDYPIKTIAAMVGYSDPLYFTKTFKKFFLISPTQVRKQFAKHEEKK